MVFNTKEGKLTMKYLDHLLTIVIEESSEIIKEACKAQRFGMDSKEPGQDLTNEERIWNEANDLVGTMELVKSLRGFGGFSREAMEAKQQKIKKFSEISIQCGRLEPKEINKPSSLREYLNVKNSAF